MDMALAAAFGVGMLAWWGWRESGNKSYLALFYLCMALGMLAKGPVAPFLAAAVILIFALAIRDLRVVVRTLWLPGIVLFCAIALPWYFAVQVRNPQFFREFILQHNLARFSSDLYHHRQPFWFYLPVTALAMAPWMVFVIAAFVESMRVWWGERKAVSAEPDFELQFRVFACCWLAVPVIFFSLSQSKLPGYILPSVPAGAVLLAEYLRRHLAQEQGEGEEESVPKWLVVLHALVAAGLVVPSVLAAYLVTQHRLPTGRPLFIALGVAIALCVAIVMTLAGRLGLRMLRFVTLIPVVLSVAAVLKLGTVSIDQTLSARPLAVELASVETHQLPLAVYGVSREMEFGLTFYRNQTTVRYERDRVPAEEHLLVAPAAWKVNVAMKTAGRRVLYLGNYAPQDVDYYWVGGAGTKS
jgi:4-amino-4-deoxy-L-arabinose transferase-like glycosyltransferase